MVIKLVRYVLTKNVVTVFSLVDNFSSGGWLINGIISAETMLPFKIT